MFQNYLEYSRRLLIVLVGFAPTIALADWPQFQGPERNGHSPEVQLLQKWPEEGPRLVWTFRTAGLGYSSPAVIGNLVLLTGAREEEEQLFCIRADTAEEIWSAPLGPQFDFQGNTWGAGPRSTPCVHESPDGTRFVYALGGGGNLICAELSTGKVVWQRHMLKDFAGEVNPIGGGPGSKPGEAKIGWGYSWSPLIDHEQLICYPGGPEGAVVALSPTTGEILWRSTDFTAQASYASVIAADISGVRHLAVLHNDGLTGIDAGNGSLLWNWQKSYSDVVIPTPIFVQEDLFYVSAGSSPSTCALIKVSRDGDQFKTEMLYPSKATRVMKNQVGGSVIVDGNVFGYSDKVGWVCQDLISGNQQWAARGPLKAGSVVTAEGLLYCYDEDNAELGLVEANPTEFVLRSRFKLPEETAFKAPGGRNWTPPVIANGHLLIRDQELLYCFDIKQRD